MFVLFLFHCSASCEGVDAVHGAPRDRIRSWVRLGCVLCFW